MLSEDESVALSEELSVSSDVSELLSELESEEDSELTLVVPLFEEVSDELLPHPVINVAANAAPSNAITIFFFIIIITSIIN